MSSPLGNEDLSDKPGERVIDKPELPPEGITNENDVHTETVTGEMQLKCGKAGKFEVLCDEPARIAARRSIPRPWRTSRSRSAFDCSLRLRGTRT